MCPAEKVNRLIADQLKAELRDAVIGREIIVLEQAESTNDAIFQIVSGPGPLSSAEGFVVFAEYQTRGRGQRGNRWESTAGKGLWFSILLRPHIQLRDSGRLTIWAVETISNVIRTEFRIEPVVKLPNDVQLYGRKVAGVLVEMRAQENAPHLAVVGIGINVNQSRDDFPDDLQERAISLTMASGRQVDLQTFAVAMLRNLDLTYRENFSTGVTAVKSSPVGTTTRDKRMAKFRKA
jgi:BirA family transcriptional regulator, biotin operon repressor / biotin---[acetyl-CoA-carboxylase] ligase